MNLFTFKGGIHPSERKELCEEKRVEIFKASKKLYISLLQHIGSPLDPIVKVGERVKAGQKLADSKAFLSAPVHSPVSGKVIEIEIHPFPISGKIKTIVIENDEKDEWEEFEKIEDYQSLDKIDLLNIIRERGVVGQGGAAFPTYVKLNPPKDKVIDTLLLNGAECEPYLNADNRVMIEYADKMIEGIKIMLYVLGIKKAILAVENNKHEALSILNQKLLKEKNIELAVLKTKYPQGGEKQLIKAVLNREVPAKTLPSEVNVVVQNVGTAKAVYDAVVLGKPLVERILTVSGYGVMSQKNLLVKIGTPFREILEYAGIDRDITEKIIMGGPMMGLSQYTEDVPVIKGTSGILALTKKEMNTYKPKSCISCGKCISACPMNLMPLMYAKLGRFEDWKSMDRYNLLDCIECGSCAYICPSNRPLTESIKVGKSKLRMIKSKERG